MEILITALGCLAVFLVQLKLYRKKAFEKLSYRCYFSKTEAVEGEEIEFTEEIENSKALALPVFKTELTASAALVFADTHSAVTDGSRFVTSYFEVKGKRKVKRVWKLRCAKRGVHGISSVVMVCTDIFGSESYSCRPDTRLPEITVLPKQYAFDTGSLMCHNLSGETNFSNPPFSDPFYADGIREYTGHEPLKFINHNASAHENKLMVNTFEASAENRVSVILTFCGHAQTDEHSIRVCAYLMSVLAAKRITAELIIAGEKNVKLPCSGSIRNCLYALAETDTNITERIPEKTSFNAFVITGSTQLAKKTSCKVIFTGSITAPQKKGIICVPERSMGYEKS